MVWVLGKTGRGRHVADTPVERACRNFVQAGDCEMLGLRMSEAAITQDAAERAGVDGGSVCARPMRIVFL
jgi:hypothetical protein